MKAAAWVVVLAAALAQAAPATCPARETWPSPEWTSQAKQVAAARPAQVKALEDYFFTLQGEDSARQGLRTDGLLILKGGVIQYERYARGYDATKRHLSWSVAKTVTATLAGVAMLKGALKAEDSVCKGLPKTRAEACTVTIQNLLEMATGFQWAEEYENASYQVSSVIAMLYGEGRADMSKFVTDHPFAHPPGTFFNYSTGDSTVLASAVYAAGKATLGEGWFYTELFDKLGMPKVTFERDAAGNHLGGSMFYATPRDYARLGYLYLNDGCWRGERLLPVGFVAKATTVNPAYITSAHAEGTPYGWDLWLNRLVPERSINALPWKGAPDDAYSMNGHWGQYVTIVPSRDLVIVRTGDDRNARVDLGKLVSLSLEVAP